MRRLAVILLTIVLAITTGASAENSPLRGRIAFLRLTDGFWQLWIMNADGSDPRQVTRSPVDKVHAAWFHGNGVWAATRVQPGVGAGFIPPASREILYHTNQGETFVVGLASGNERRILEGLIVTDAAVGPDGRRLAYGLPPEDLVKGKTSLWVSSLDGTDRRKVAGGAGNDALAPAWIEEGAEAASRVVGAGFIPPASGVGAARRAAQEEWPLLFRQCVMLNHMQARHDFWVARFDDGALLAAADGGAPLAAPVSVGAQFIAPAIKPVQGDDEKHKFDQTVSSNGVVAYSSIRSGRYEIWKIPLNGGTPRQITNLRSYAGNPTWSPDGQRLVFDSDKDGAQEIYVIGADGKGLVRLTTGPEPSRKPVWGR